MSFYFSRISLSFYCCLLLALTACSSVSQQAERKDLVASLAEVANKSEQAGDYKTAANMYQSLTRRAPNSIDIALAYARNSRLNGDPNAAAVFLDEFMTRHSPTTLLLAEKGRALLATGDSLGALNALKKASKKSPDNWRILSAKGIAHDSLKQYDAAQKSYENALKLSPNNPDVTNNLALSLAHSGRLEEAISLMEQLAFSFNATAQHRQNLALLKALSGDLEEARILTEQDLSPRDAANNMEFYKSLNR